MMKMMKMMMMMIYDDDGCISGITVSPLFCQNFAWFAFGVCLVPAVAAPEGPRNMVG